LQVESNMALPTEGNCRHHDVSRKKKNGPIIEVEKIQEKTEKNAGRAANEEEDEAS